MQKLTAQAFRDLLSSVRDSISSLKSCQDRELPNERRLLGNVVAELREASPLRRNDALVERQAEMLAEAQAILDARPAPTPLHEQRFPLGDRLVSWEFLMST